MQVPPELENEAQRLRRLRQLGVLDTEAEAVLDAFTELAASITGMPIALITLVDNDRQWFKSAVGMPQGGQTPRSLSFCGHAIAGDEIFEIEDARHDPRFSDNPYVLHAPHVAHYAGAPLVMPGGERIGTLCVVGDQPGKLPERTREQLVTLAQSVVRVLLMRENERSLKTRLETERALRLAEARWQVMTDLLPQIVWSAGPNGEQAAFNQRWTEFTGVPALLADAGTWLARIHAEDQDDAREAWKQSVARGDAFEREFRLQHKSGTYHWVLARALAVRGDDEAVVRWIATFTDIQEQKQAQRDLQEANRQKDEFLAMLAHELRNPLAPISTAAQLLRMAADDPQRVLQTSELITRQVGHMTELVDDLLDVSRVTRGLVRIDREQVDLRQVLHDALEQTRPQIEARHHRLDLPDISRPLRVMGDRVRLVQVLANLIGNAAKYTADGGHIQVEMEEREDKAVLCVKDDGSGIDPGLLPHVFDLFTQAKRTPDRAQGGLGVGLALVRSLVELHGGTVEAKSEGPGKGSTFTVVLPRLLQAPEAAPGAPEAAKAAKAADVAPAPTASPARDAQEEQAAEPPPMRPAPAGMPSSPAGPAGESAAPPHAAAQPPSPAAGGWAAAIDRKGMDAEAAPAPASLAVMVVDDNADAAELMGIWLESQGHEVRVCLDPFEALEAARQRPARVYVLDIGLPGMDGNDLARRLREDPRNRDATLIALTGYGQAQDILQSRKAGFDQHFVKPADPERLAAVIETLGSAESGHPPPVKEKTPG